MHPAVADSLLGSRPVGRLWRYVAASLVVHTAVVLGVLAYNTWVAGSRPEPPPQTIRASLVRLGKPRDPKLLPRKEQPPPPPREVKPPPQPSTTPAAPPPPAKVAVPVPAVKPTPPPPAPQKGAPKAEDTRKRLFGAFDKLARPSEEEPEGAEDGDPEGDSATAEGERYFGLLRTQVRRHYDVANTLAESERLYLRAQVAMRLDRSGQVLESRLVKTSGNALFDSAVLAAVSRAAPFSPPPDKLRDMLHKSGVVLEFSP